LLQIKEREREREREREERKEQDRRFADSARRDGERISALMEAERREARAKAEAEAAREREERRRAEQQREREKRRVEREGWRRWVHGLEGMDGEGEGEVRVAVRLPDGGRVVRRFAGGQSLTALYAFVDGRLTGGVAGTSGQSLSPAGHPPSALERAMEEQITLAGGADQWWGFQLALAYPRQIIAWEEGRKVGEMEGLRGGAQLVVSLLHGGVERGGSGKEGGDDDEYESESD
jgi:FAS-associated factor 2